MPAPGGSSGLFLSWGFLSQPCSETNDLDKSFVLKVPSTRKIKEIGNERHRVKSTVAVGHWRVKSTQWNKLSFSSSVSSELMSVILDEFNKVLAWTIYIPKKDSNSYLNLRPITFFLQVFLDFALFPI